MKDSFLEAYQEIMEDSMKHPSKYTHEANVGDLIIPQTKEMAQENARKLGKYLDRHAPKRGTTVKLWA